MKRRTNRLAIHYRAESFWNCGLNTAQRFTNCLNDVTCEWCYRRICDGIERGSKIVNATPRA